MITILAAAVSLAASLATDVPYLPQTDALCGGAAAAMVFRYWGDAHADVQAFAPLVDRRAGGIAGGALTQEIRALGWRTEIVTGSLDALAARVHDGQPVIVLVADRGVRYHYLVVTDVRDEAITAHDPAWGPSRHIRAAEFLDRWKATGFWSLVILPGSPRISTDTGVEGISPGPVAPDGGSDACDARLNRALDAIRVEGLDRADALLGDVRAQCPATAGPIRELSGVRFAQRRWSDAASLARDALDRDPRDHYALDLLGSALFMDGDELGALRAWNQIGKPRVDRVRIDGLHRTRYQMVAELMAIQPNMLLTPEVYERARRRLADLPDASTTRLAFTPEANGYATVDAGVVEIAATPRGPVAWAGAAARTAANRAIEASVPGSSGQGEIWSASWRWWANRPSVSVGLAAPHVGALPGVWRLDGSWQSDTYNASAGARIVESRSHGGLTMSDWLSGRIRYSLSAGLDAWSGDRKAASIGGALEHVSFADRLALSVDATRWTPLNGAAFNAVGAHATARSTTGTRGWVARSSIGFERVSDAAPLALWPGAGEGLARMPLLRAHPLLSDGAVDVTGSSAFGRTLAFGGVELQRWLERPALLRLGVAGFADAARASRQEADGRTPVYVDVGVGLRVKVPGTPGVLRADVAHGLRDGADALTIGWMF